MKRLIVTADDFGASTEINEAVVQAHRKGVLTTASLMVSAPAAEDAVRRARELETLRVGLHVVLVDGAPTLPEAAVTRLVNGDGRFLDDPVEAGMRFWFSPRARTQLESEIRAQFEAFATTGLAFDHVNAHHNFHLHPTVAEIVVRLATEFGAPAVRVPDEPVLEAICRDPAERRRRRRQRALLGPFSARLRARARRLGLATPDAVFGFYDTGAMDTEKLVRAIANVPDGLTEIYLHPATRVRAAVDVPHPASAPAAEREFRALVHPRTRRVVEKFDIALTTFSGI